MLWGAYYGYGTCFSKLVSHQFSHHTGTYGTQEGDEHIYRDMRIVSYSRIYIYMNMLTRWTLGMVMLKDIYLFHPLYTYYIYIHAEKSIANCLRLLHMYMYICICMIYIWKSVHTSIGRDFRPLGRVMPSGSSQKLGLYLGKKATRKNAGCMGFNGGLIGFNEWFVMVHPA